MDRSFIREFDINLVSKTLKLRQKIEGDVSCVVWDSSIVLAKYLEKMCEEQNDFLENSSVVELGAGVGCVGLTAACLGANVLLTDLPEALPLLKSNIENNKSNWQNTKGSAETMPLVWGRDAEISFSPNIILLADCIYYKESIALLINTLRELASSDTEILLSQELRDTEKQKDCWKYFIRESEKYFNMYLIPSNEQHSEYSSPDIVLLKLTKL